MKTYLLISLLACLLMKKCASCYSEQELAEYLAGDYENVASEKCHEMQLAQFAHATDLLNATKKKELDALVLKDATWEKEQWSKYWKDADWENFQDEFVKRQLKFLSILGVAAMDESSLVELNKVQSYMVTTYSTAKVCPYRHKHCDIKRQGIPLDPDIATLLATSTDYDELEYLWRAWRDATGRKMRKKYVKYVDLSNKAARINDFADMGAMWRFNYETDNFVQVLQDLWKQVEPLYLSLHSYVHDKLRSRYGNRMGDDGLIPAHITGNMWAQSWVNLYDLVVPFPESSPFDVTDALLEQNYSVLRMFKTADDFYQSLGLLKNDMSYDESKGAMVTRPKGKEVVCHASAWDMCNKKDFRIKMCTQVNNTDFIVIHHEMGHIQYFQQYRNQPITFRGSVNPGFTEAIGDVIALSVSTPQHLQKIGLLSNYTDSPKASINALMKAALAKVAFLPYGLLIDMWRWDVFSGKVKESEWNAHWWGLRERIQKVKAPVTRSERDFDPGAKYHVASGSKYISYFLSYIVQFQIHKALCITANKYNPDDPSSPPLHKCDIFHSKEAGAQLEAGLSLGLSTHWTKVLKILTGQTKLDGTAMLEYFAPLQRFLDEQNKRSGRGGSRATNSKRGRHI